METHWSSEPEGNLTITFDPVLSSVSLRGRNLCIISSGMMARMVVKTKQEGWGDQPADNLDGVLSRPLRRRLLLSRHCFYFSSANSPGLSFHSTSTKVSSTFKLNSFKF